MTWIQSMIKKSRDAVALFLNFSDLKTTKIQYKNLETHIRLPNLLKLIKESIIRKYYYIDHQPHFTEEM